MFISEQKEIERFLKKNGFKFITSEEIMSSIESFNSCFFDDIKDPYIDKVHERRRSIVHTYNDEKKNIVLEHSPKIPKIY